MLVDGAVRTHQKWCSLLGHLQSNLKGDMKNLKRHLLRSSLIRSTVEAIWKLWTTKFWGFQIDSLWIPAIAYPPSHDKRTICKYICSTAIIKCTIPNLASIKFHGRAFQPQMSHTSPFSYQVLSEWMLQRAVSCKQQQKNFRTFFEFTFYENVSELSCTAQ